LGDQKKIVVIGEAGSGKTELSIHLAIALNKAGAKKVRVFDMDQTKPLFRLRDVSRVLTDQGICFTREDQFMDSPVVPHGVEAALNDPQTYAVFDIGGGQSGALCMGQFQQALKKNKAYAFYTINPYRCFSDTSDRIQKTMDAILNCCGLEDIHIICNPYCGYETDGRVLEEGGLRLSSALEPLELCWDAMMISQSLWEKHSAGYKRCLCIRPYLQQVLDIDII
jgi:hypothetical protein